MKLLKPPWVNHGKSSSKNATKNPISAIDFHPKGKKFATGGKGEDSGRVAIWNVQPMINSKCESDENIPKLLCQMDNHLANVNCVRWSHSGDYLASAGDDKLVMIWQLSQYGGGTVFGSSQATTESWRCKATLLGHEGDILDITWAPNDARLASASIDNDIIVWDMRSSKPEILKKLKGHTGLVKGVSFDPIGKYLASQSEDKSLRIWRTSDWKEEKAITEPFLECSGTTPVLRLDWSPEGQTLISAHAINGGGPTAQIIDRDGWKLQRDLVGHRKAVTCVRFSSCLYQKKSNVNNGKRIIGNTCAIGSKDLCISVWQNFLKRPLVVLRDLFTEPVLDLSWDYTGRRLLACSWDGTVAFMEFDKKEVGETLSATEKNSFFKRVYGSSYASDQPVRVIRENPLVPSIPMVVENDATPLQSADQSKLAPEPINEVQLVTPTSSQPLMPIGKQVESRMADGRRRITPMFIPPPSSLSLDATHATTITSDQITFTSSAQPSSQIVVERLEEGVDDDFEKQKSEKKTSAPLPEHFDVIKRPRMTAVQSTPKKSQGALSVNFQGAGGGRIKLPILEAKRMYSSSVEQNGILLNIEANNEAMTSGRDSLHKLICSRGSTKSWEQVFSSRILALECNNQVICVGTEDGSFHMFSVEGCRKFPPIVTSGISSLQVLRHFVFLLTSNGRVNVWNMSTSISTCRNVSVEDILKGSSVEIVNCSLTVNGMPVISLRDGNTYAYSQPIESWVLLAALEDPVTKSCDVQIPAFSAKEKKEYSLSSTFSSSLRPRSTVRCSTEVQTACTQSYLEHQVCASLAIESPGEYRAWLLALVKHLTTTAMEHRLRSICRDLLGPMYKSPAWSPEILGLSKHSLLKEILVIILPQVRLQRLYTEFAEQLRLGSDQK
ncbi:protein HIRA homolog isoform X2 [Artemia franciscana]